MGKRVVDRRARFFFKIFAKFSKFSQVFRSFRNFRTCSDAFGCVRTLGGRTKSRKHETKILKIICIFTRFLRSCVRSELATPQPTDRKKNRKKQSMSQTIDQVVAIKTHTESSKSELSSRGKRPFKVLEPLSLYTNPGRRPAM